MWHVRLDNSKTYTYVGTVAFQTEIVKHLIETVMCYPSFGERFTLGKREE